MKRNLLKYKEFINEKVIQKEMPIPNDVKEIAQEFFKNGKQLYVVGGAVRDFLQGKIPHDYDLVTDALPHETKDILKDWNVSDEQGKNFGVLRVYTDSEPLGHEVAAFRKDISKGRDVKGDDDKVEIGEHITIEDDVKRRDLTINALFYDINNQQIVDLVGGIDDIKNNIIRTVGRPEERFDEDRLRILRVFRFTARTGGEIDKTTSESIKKDNRLRNVGIKDDVPQERIIEEIMKAHDHSMKDWIIMKRYFELFSEYNMWDEVFPKLKINDNISDKVYKTNELSIIFTHLLMNNDIRKLKKHIVENLKISNKLYNNILFLWELENSDIKDNVYKLAKLKNSLHIPDNLIRLYGGDNIEEFINYCNDGFVIDGLDLMKQGFKGREIEVEKERLEIERFKNDYLI